jgi:hypothetical protein
VQRGAQRTDERKLCLKELSGGGLQGARQTAGVLPHEEELEVMSHPVAVGK